MSLRLITTLPRRLRLSVARRRRRAASDGRAEHPWPGGSGGSDGPDGSDEPTGPAPLAARLIESKRRRVRRVTSDGSILSDAA